MAIILTLAIIFFLLCINEIWWRTKKHHSEISRKSVHITIGIYASFWPFYLSFTDIKLLAIAGLFVLLLSKYFNVIKAIHNVNRSTWGEALSAISVGLLAFLTNNKWIYAASLLQMALADGLAAVIGVIYGKKNQYKLIGHTKSVAGSLTFFIASLVILIVFQLAGHLSNGILYLSFTSLVATALENIGIKGIDNLAVPVAVLLMIR